LPRELMRYKNVVYSIIERSKIKTRECTFNLPLRTPFLKRINIFHWKNAKN